MAEAEATKRGKGRPKGPDSKRFLLFLSTLEAGPLAQKDIRARTGLKRATVSRYSMRYPHFVEKTPNGYSLTLGGRLCILNLEIQRFTNKMMLLNSRAFKWLAPRMVPIMEAGEAIERATEYLEKKADIVSRHPKFEAIEDPTLGAQAVHSFLAGELCYGCLDPAVVNEKGSLEPFLTHQVEAGRRFCKNCGLELFPGGGDVHFVPPRKRSKRTIKDERIGSIEPDSEELRELREKSEANARGS